MKLKGGVIIASGERRKVKEGRNKRVGWIEKHNRTV